MIVDHRTFHDEAVRDLDGLVSWIGPADLARRTPCAGWDLRRLVAHLVGQHHGFAAAVTAAAEVEVPVDAFTPRPIEGDDWRATVWLPSVAALRSAFAGAPLDQPVVLAELSPTHRFDVAAAISFHFVDTVAHCWDVATALGIDYRPSDEVVDAFLAESRRVPRGDARTVPGAAFGPVVDVAGDAWAEALGLLGRDGVSATRARGRVRP
jgi:uncharacterized protein (TIGR03086 family)